MSTVYPARQINAGDMGLFTVISYRKIVRSGLTLTESSKPVRQEEINKYVSLDGNMSYTG